MKTYFGIFALLLAPVLVMAQLNNDLTKPAFGNLKTDVDVSLGSTVMSSGSGSAFMNYAFPKLRMSPNEDLQIETGVLMMNTSMNNFQPYNAAGQMSQNSINSNFTDSYAFASGTYQVNDNLVIRGSAFKKFNMNSQMQQQTHPQAFNFDAHGMNVGFRYKLSENSSIGASFHYQKGADPFGHGYNNSYYNGFSPLDRTSPFSPDPF